MICSLLFSLFLTCRNNLSKFDLFNKIKNKKTKIIEKYNDINFDTDRV